MKRDLELPQLMTEYGGPIRRISRSYEADPEKARELCQDIWLQVYRSLGRFRGDCNLGTWVYRIAHNTGISHVTRESRKIRWIGIEELVDELEVPSARAETRVALSELLELIRNLRPLDREVFTMYLEGHRHSEIAEVSGLSESNISTKISRIKQFLSSFNKQYEGLTDE